MKEVILLIILTILWQGINSISRKLDTIIELNTPEQINVIPEQIIIEVD